jgi:hypothetical protein
MLLYSWRQQSGTCNLRKRTQQPSQTRPHRLLDEAKVSLQLQNAGENLLKIPHRLLDEAKVSLQPFQWEVRSLS